MNQSGVCVGFSAEMAFMLSYIPLYIPVIRNEIQEIKMQTLKMRILISENWMWIQVCTICSHHNCIFRIRCI